MLKYAYFPKRMLNIVRNNYEIRITELPDLGGP